MAESAPAPQARRGGRSLWVVLTYLRRWPVAAALSVGLLLVNLAIEMSMPQVIGQAMTDLEAHQRRGDSFDPWWYVRLFGALVLVRAGVGYLLGPIRNCLVQRVLNDLRADIFDALQRLAFRFHDRANTGELISRSTTDVARLQDFLFACLFLFVDISVALAATMVLIFFVDPTLGALAVVTAVPTVTLIGYFAAKLQPQWRQVYDLHGAMTNVIQESIAGVRVVKAFAREKAEVEKFRGRKEEFLNTLLKAVNYWAARIPLAQFVFGLSTPLVLFVGGDKVIRGELPVGDLAKVIFYLMAIGHRMGMVGQFTNILQNASASADRILEIIREPRLIASGHRSLPTGNGRVEFSDVSFQFSASESTGRSSREKPNDGLTTDDGTSAGPGLAPAALHDVSFVAEAGQTVAIVGPTGSGKSTLVNLIPRFHDADAGEVRLDGVPVRELRLHDLRRSVGFIFQETFLFSATVAENIAYGRPDAGAEAIEAAARAAQAHEFIERLDRGYATMIGERGVSLSGGQRQRLGIARAFLMNPRVLVLDDATASVDAETERLIQEAMRQLSVGRTTFVIAQRVSTVKHADLILVLRDGRIVGRGRHEDLLRTSDFYRRVCEQQIRG